MKRLTTVVGNRESRRKRRSHARENGGIAREFSLCARAQSFHGDVYSLDPGHELKGSCSGQKHFSSRDRPGAGVVTQQQKFDRARRRLRRALKPKSRIDGHVLQHPTGGDGGRLTQREIDRLAAKAAAITEPAPTVYKRQQIAHHEAGHAVIARAFGMRVLSVEICQDGKGGVVQYESAYYRSRDADVASQLAALDKDLLVDCADFAAEQHFWPDEDLLTSYLSDDDDILGTAAIITLLRHGQQVSETFSLEDPLLPPIWDESNDHADKARIRADRLVADHLPAIERVAAALLIRRTLDPNELDAIIAGGDRLLTPAHPELKATAP